MNLLKESIDAVNSVGKKIGSSLISGLSRGAVNLSGNEGKAVSGLVENMISGTDTWNKMRLDKERIGRKQELQTERMFSSTSHLVSEAMLEPSVFYSNSTTFPYNLFDFFLRAFFAPHWESRIHI